MAPVQEVYSLLPCSFSFSVSQIYMMTINDPRFETGIHFDDGQLHAQALRIRFLFPPPLSTLFLYCALCLFLALASGDFCGDLHDRTMGVDQYLKRHARHPSAQSEIDARN